MARKDNAPLGAAGEYYVAYKLSQMGYLVALTPGGAAHLDLMVGNPLGSNFVAIQVKTAGYAWVDFKRTPERSYWKWRVRAKAAQLTSDRLFYAFVNLGGLNGTEVFIVPAAKVAAHDALKAGWFPISQAEEQEHLEKWTLITDLLGPVLPSAPEE